MRSSTHRKEAIAVLAGGFTQEPGTEIWRSSRFDETPTVAEPGSEARYITAHYLWREQPDIPIIVSGGRGQGDALFPKGETCASILRKELEDSGVPAECIVEENTSGNTAQQLRNIDRLALEIGFEHVWIVTNAFHVPRVHAMICDSRLNLKKLLQSADIIPAENILIQIYPAWEKKIAHAYTSQILFEIIAREQRGVEMIKSGQYQYKL